MKITNELTDQSVLSELGERIARRRLDLQLTQGKLAQEAGIAKRTLERIESGHSAQSTTLIRVLRTLGLLANLKYLLPTTGPRPMELLKGKHKPRQRASRTKKEDLPEPWTWNDES